MGMFRQMRYCLFRNSIFNLLISRILTLLQDSADKIRAICGPGSQEAGWHTFNPEGKSQVKLNHKPVLEDTIERVPS